MTMPAEVQRLPSPYRDENDCVAALAAELQGLRGQWPAVLKLAGPWVEQVRGNPAPFWAMESLLREYPITRPEGLALMRLAEALLRVPDAETAIALTADQLGRADFDSAGDGPHKVFASLSAAAIGLSKKFLPGEDSGGLMGRLGSKTVVGATVRAIQLLGRQFVLGRNIDEAQDEAAAARKELKQLTFSYDMLGEGARTEKDAERYLAAYHHAIGRIAARGRAASPMAADGISIKLSALFTRYEVLQRERVFATLLPRVLGLVDAAAAANMNLTIDAEEVDRLEISLDLLEALADQVAARHPQWQGLGLAVQAYQTRARAVIDAVAQIARARGLRFMVRLVKGAYWDGEIKRAQELGLAHYPVFTHKAHTDLSYLACAQALLAHKDVIYPQFASHNAGTVAAIVQMAREAGAPFEMQRLHGMGEGVYREVLRAPSIACRVYAPVGEHRDLLAYLVRRLLENGANSSFVHQLADPAVAVPELLSCPLDDLRAAPLQPLPLKLYEAAGEARLNSRGADLADPAQRAPLLEALCATVVERVPEATPTQVEAAMARLQAGVAGWAARRWRSAPPCCAAPPTPWTRSCRCSAACWSRRRTRRWPTAWPRCARRSTSCATTRWRPRWPATPPCRAAACSSASRRGTSRWPSLPARWSRRWWPATRWPPSPPSRPRRWRWPACACCGRPVFPRTRCSCCTAAARRSVRRWWRTTQRPACASPAAPRWPRSSSAAWPPRAAARC
jgi:RHH-type proline utilization regulon transcriptional repressor/proline dehydrogenase/delta 1-pyrroline-5-carboxylate dehydrogenase